MSGARSEPPLTHEGRQSPALEQDGLELEGDGEHSDDDVGQREVGDVPADSDDCDDSDDGVEDVHVGDGAQPPEDDDVHDETVPDDGDDGGDHVQGDEEHRQDHRELVQRLLITETFPFVDLDIYTRYIPVKFCRVITHHEGFSIHVDHRH